jgi:tagaturonate reductase
VFPERIIQFGEGNFLRGFADWMVDHLNAAGMFEGSVAVVQPVRQGLAELLNEQDGVYTLLLRGIQNGERVGERRVVTSISRCLNPYEDWASVVGIATRPELRFAISNTTEAGIAHVAEAYDGQHSPASFPAKVTALLWERFKALGGSAESGLVFLPCELIDRNGAKLREHVLRHAAEWNAGDDFIAWIESANHFLNTLVDRIVPGYPGKEAEALREELGYDDRLMVAAEIFHLWVIEGPAHLAKEIPFHEAGLNVVWTEDMTPYRSRKVRVLNGAHTATVPAAFLAGLNTVGEMMDDPDFGPLVRRAVFDEILPVLDMDDAGKRDYASAVLERFRNPFIRHELLSITLNSISKWRVRVLPSLLDSLERNGTLPPLLTFSLAAWIRFYDGRPVSETELQGNRGGLAYPVRDDAPVLAFFAGAWSEFHGSNDLAKLTHSVLSNTKLWGRDLTLVAGLQQAVEESLGRILTDGARKSIP